MVTWNSAKRPFIEMFFRFPLLISLLVLSALACAGRGEGGSINPSTTPPGRSRHPIPTDPAEPDTPAPASDTPVPATDTPAPITPPPPARQSSFVFAAAGDHGANSNTDASLSLLARTNPAFYLALGDMDYDQTSTDAAWCDYIKQRLPTLGATFPFELLAGNHEATGGPNGDIRNHAACLPDRMNSTGVYAAEYYFDYPAQNPLTRTIMIAANTVVGGVTYSYAPGNAHYDWLSTAIDSARAAGIPWVIVGMHKNCITTGQKICEIGAPLLNLLMEKKVDLILQGHDHNYQRSKQLAHSPACAALAPASYNSGCVADDGSDSTYAKREGPVLVIAGTFGVSSYAVNPADTEAGYFAAIGSGFHGFTKFTVSRDQLVAEFVASTGGFSDGFTISGG